MNDKGMNNEEKTLFRVNVDEVMGQIAAKLADPSSDMVVPLERDMAIIMACCAVARSEGPEPPDSSDVEMSKGRFDSIIEMLRDPHGPDNGPLRIAQYLLEEADDDRWEEFQKLANLKEAEDGPPADMPAVERVPGADPPEHPGFADNEAGVPEPAAGAFTGTEESVAEGKQADGSPIPTPEHVNEEGTEGYGREVMPEELLKAVKFSLQIPEGGEMPDIGGWRYAVPITTLVYQVVGEMEPRRVNVTDALADIDREEEAEADDVR